jgi:DNA-binding response OmpR family regulator
LSKLKASPFPDTLLAVRILVDVAADRLCAEIVDLLQRAGHEVERGAPTSAKRFDLVLVGSPEVAERLRRERPLDAIIVVTKIGDVPARVRALEVGADDAFDASFAPSQMMARVGAAGRRAAMMPRPADCVEVDECAIDLTAMTARRAGVTIELTAREIEIIRWFVAHAGQVVSREDLLAHVWRVAPGNATRAVDVAIVGLRQKLEREAAEPRIIVSVRGVGYRWDPLTNG